MNLLELGAAIERVRSLIAEAATKMLDGDLDGADDLLDEAYDHLTSIIVRGVLA